MAERAPRIYVLAGTNGAGKSSIGGENFRLSGSSYFNPDESTTRLLAANPGMSQTEANGAAWREGVRLLQTALSRKLDFALETTLGGRTITTLLETAAARGFEVRIWYVALASPELHLARVQARVRKGGHDIPEADVRRRYTQSRLNLIRLLPALAELRVFDNSVEADPYSGHVPRPRLVLEMRRGEIVGPANLSRTPEWAKAIVAAAVKGGRRRRPRR